MSCGVPRHLCNKKTNALSEHETRTGLYSSVAERQSCKLKVLGPILSGGCALPSAARRLAPCHVEGFMRDPPAVVAFAARASR